jgi:hypothetical protein
MNLNKKVVNNKLTELIEVYNFYFDYFSIRLCLNDTKFEFHNTRSSSIIFGYRMISNEKVVNNKFV